MEKGKHGPSYKAKLEHKVANHMTNAEKHGGHTLLETPPHMRPNSNIKSLNTWTDNVGKREDQTKKACSDTHMGKVIPKTN